MPQSFLDAAEAATLFAFFAALSFVVIYAALAPFYRNAIGWARIAMDACVAVALMPSALYYLFGIYLAGSYTAAVAEISGIALVGVVSLWNAALVVREQFRKRGSGK